MVPQRWCNSKNFHYTTLHHGATKMKTCVKHHTWFPTERVRTRKQCFLKFTRQNNTTHTEVLHDSLKTQWMWFHDSRFCVQFYVIEMMTCFTHGFRSTVRTWVHDIHEIDPTKQQDTHETFRKLSQNMIQIFLRLTILCSCLVCEHGFCS